MSRRAYLRACFMAAAALLAPHLAWAQLQPHRAEYTLRLGTAANAPRVGTAIQDITLDCAGWHITRELSAEIPLTASWKITLASRLTGEEERDGNGLRYRVVLVPNGAERETQGKVGRADGEIRADILAPDGPEQVVLPSGTLMPVAAVGRLVDRLLGGAATFPVLLFAPEAGEAFQLDLKELESGALQAAPPALKSVPVPAARSWAVLATVTHPGRQDQKPLATARARVFSTGVLDRLTVDAGIVTVTADLQALEMHEPPVCPDR
jgi:hypothetical protein